MKTFCTLFDHNYLYKGLCLYNSLRANCPEFTLWVLAMSDKAYELLDGMSLQNVKLIRLEDFEDEELKAAKQTRSVVEYFWTLTPSIPLYVLRQNPALDMVAYIDADCFFFSDPQPIYEEMGTDSVLIIEHRYAPERKAWEKTSGRFNVELLIFRRDDIGLAVLNEWRAQCNEWCYYREEEGRFGDQMYLDAWPEKYDRIHILQHKGGGLAPWNIKNYTISFRNENTFVDDDRLVFYHFHALKIFKADDYEFSSGYKFSKSEVSLVYDPYVTALKQAMRQVEKVDPSFNYGFSFKEGKFSKMYNKLISKIRMPIKEITK